MKVTGKQRKAITVTLLVTALLLLAGAGFHSHKVFEIEEDEDDFGFMTFTRISEFQLTVDSTFQGVDRIDGRLYSTYDRLEGGGGKRPCPT